MVAKSLVMNEFAGVICTPTGMVNAYIVATCVMSVLITQVHAPSAKTLPLLFLKSSLWNAHVLNFKRWYHMEMERADTIAIGILMNAHHQHTKTLVTIVCSVQHIAPCALNSMVNALSVTHHSNWLMVSASVLKARLTMGKRARTP